MSTQDIVQKLWNLCNVLRDDGITYHQYVTEVIYILFLKMADETGADKDIPKAYRWGSLTSRSGIDLKKHYYTLLSKLGEESVGRVAQIYANASSTFPLPPFILESCKLKLTTDSSKVIMKLPHPYTIENSAGLNL